MYDFKEATYTVLEFVTIDGYYTDIETKKDKIKVHLNFPTIIEMSAVKIKNGKIVDRYSTYVGIDGCNEYDIKLEEESPEICGITAEHLIGAPSLYTALERLFGFTKDCTIITKYAANDFRNPLHIVKKYIEPIYTFNNPVLSINNIIAAKKIKDSLSNCIDEQDDGVNYYKLALSLEDKESYADMVAEYLDVDIESGRQDSLSRALIMARLFIALSNEQAKLILDSETPF